MSKGRFDIIRACFYLVAIVIVAHLLVAVMGVGACLWHSRDIIANENFKCDSDGRLMEIMASTLAATIAFAGGWMRSTPSDTKDDDDK